MPAEGTGKMDIWVVGAAAAAGYIAKYWQNRSQDDDSPPELSSRATNYKNPKTQSHPFRRLSQRKKLTEDSPADGSNFSDLCKLNSIAEITVSASDGCEIVGSLGNDDSNVLSMSSLPPGFPTNENLEHEEGGNGDMGDNCDKTQVNEVNILCTYVRNRGSLRAKSSYWHFLKPLSSLESCMMAQLYKEHERMEEYVLSTLPSPSTTIRPFLVTDGKGIVSRASSDHFSHMTGSDDIRLAKDEIMCGVPPLPKIRALDFPKKIKSRTRKCLNDRLSSSSKKGSGTRFLLQNEPHDRMFFFCLGISIGVISSLISNRREVGKLEELLRQTENLVQDLQEELEMKDSLTVKEIANEYYGSHGPGENPFHNRASNPLFPVQNEDNSTKNNGIGSHNEKGEESSEAMCKIEAELEAEFERLGLDMNASGLERRLSDLLELDPEFVADFSQDELRPDMVHGQAAAPPESDQDVSGTLTTPSGNYAVSPRDLTLRLQKVIQSRLEERVKELETALENSERKLQLMESEHKLAQKTLSSELRFFSGKRSPSAGDGNFMAHPLVMDLSGEALDAYSGEYEELTKMNESDEEDSPSGFYKNNQQLGLNPFRRSVLESPQNGGAISSILHFTQRKEKMPEKHFSSQLKTSTEHVSGIQELLYHVVSEDESSDCEDEKQKQLIKQIVEKTKKGSPVLLNAQRLLFSMDENDD